MVILNKCLSIIFPHSNPIIDCSTYSLLNALKFNFCVHYIATWKPGPWPPKSNITIIFSFNMYCMNSNSNNVFKWRMRKKKRWWLNRFMTRSDILLVLMLISMFCCSNSLFTFFNIWFIHLKKDFQDEKRFSLIFT